MKCRYCNKELGLIANSRIYCKNERCKERAQALRMLFRINKELKLNNMDKKYIEEKYGKK